VCLAAGYKQPVCDGGGLVVGVEYLYSVLDETRASPRRLNCVITQRGS
jgi:hypothetical protein